MKLNRAASFVILILFLLFNSSALYAEDEKDPCEGQDTAVVIDTGLRMMWTCKDSHKLKDYHISIGRGGIDKREQGDKKTPLGEYTLGIPRSSEKFGVFIPVGYPNQDQKNRGYTGSAIGIHGPDRLFKRLEETDAWFDWTKGCIAVGSDDDISEIALWLKENNVTKVIIR
jgi:L,D-peptidoglycan transpeptidase YkuD (ErfK/YbiS/YcfS/YnhG family)